VLRRAVGLTLAGIVSCIKVEHLPSLSLEIVGDEGEGGVVAGLVVGLVGGDEDGEVFRGGEPGDGEPHGDAAGVGEGGAGGLGLIIGQVNL
jgi:hypothetical protein